MVTWGADLVTGVGPGRFRLGIRVGFARSFTKAILHRCGHPCRFDGGGEVLFYLFGVVTGKIQDVIDEFLHFWVKVQIAVSLNLVGQLFHRFRLQLAEKMLASKKYHRSLPFGFGCDGETGQFLSFVFQSDFRNVKKFLGA